MDFCLFETPPIPKREHNHRPLLGVNTTLESRGFVRLLSKLIRVWSEKISNDTLCLLLWNLIGELQFLTDQPTEYVKTNFTSNSHDFARLQSELVGVWSESFFGYSRNLLISDPIGKLLFSTIDRLNILTHFQTQLKKSFFLSFCLKIKLREREREFLYVL